MRKTGKKRRGVSLAGPNGKTTLAGLGLKTPAAQHMATVEDAVWFDADGNKVNPNGVKRARRRKWVEHYHTQGHLTKRQFMAAELLQIAFERTQRSPEAIKKVNVDTFPKPDAAIAILMDRIGKYHNVARHVPQFAAPYIDHVVINNCPLTGMPGCKGGRAFDRYMDRLSRGLESLADEISI